MKSIICACLVCILISVFTLSESPAPADEQKPAELTREVLNGNWRAVKGVLAGDELPMSMLQSISLTIDKNGYRVKQGENTDIGEIKCNLKADPAELDLIGKDGPTKGITLLAIAKVEGDVMTVAYNLGVLDGDAKRPAAFVSDRSENRNLVLTYQRVK